MQYIPRFTNGRAFHFPLSKVVCVGRNYADHARELNNPVPAEPILFIKPSTSVTEMSTPLELPPAGKCHYETELAILIGQNLKDADAHHAERAIEGVGLALDLTLRDVQAMLKEKSHPWEIAKCFDGSCPLTRFVPITEMGSLEHLEYSLDINGERRQTGHTGNMITPIIPLIQAMSRHFTLLAGDVVLTGTPAGVGELKSGDELELRLGGDKLVVSTNVA